MHCELSPILTRPFALYILLLILRILLAADIFIVHFFELFYVTRNIALDFTGVRNGTKGKRGLGARKSKRLHHSKYPFQFQSPAAFYSSKVILYHVTVSVNNVHCSFPLKYDLVSWVKPLHAHFPCHLNLAYTLLLAYY